MCAPLNHQVAHTKEFCEVYEGHPSLKCKLGEYSYCLPSVLDLNFPQYAIQGLLLLVFCGT